MAAIQHASGLLLEAVSLFAQAANMNLEYTSWEPWLRSTRGYQYCDMMLDANGYSDVLEALVGTPDIDIPSRYLLDNALIHLILGRAHLAGVQRDDNRGSIDGATSHLREALEVLRQAAIQEFLPLGLLARAARHIYTSAFDDARIDLDEAMDIATRCGFRLHEADAHLGYARLRIAEGTPAAAREHLAKALEIIDVTGYHRRDDEVREIEGLLSSA